MVLDNTPQAVFWKNLDLVFIGCNRSFAIDAGVSVPENIIGKTDFDVAWSREQAEAFRRWDRHVISTGIPQYHIVEAQTQADGKQAWLDTNKVPLLDARGRVVGVMGTYEDITERKQAELALRQAHDDLERRVAKRTSELSHSNDLLRQEIVERQSAENALRLSQERYDTAVNAGKVGVWDWDLRTQEFYIAPSLKAMLGYADREIGNRLSDWIRLVHPVDREAVEAALQAQLLNLTAIYEKEHRMQHRDGATRWMLTRGTLLRDLHQAPTRMIGSATDITDLKSAEAEEREQRTLAEALRDTAGLLNSTLNLTEVLDRILANIGRVVPHDRADIMLVEAGMVQSVRQRAGLGQDSTNASSSLAFPVSNLPSLELMELTGTPFIIPDVERYAPWVKRPDTEWVRSYLGAPIRVEQQVIGFINLNSATAGFFNVTHAERLQVFADQAASAIQNARSYAQAQELAAVEERQRLARDLHDEVSQTLWTASLLADVLPAQFEQNQEDALLSLEKLRKLTRGALAEMRTLLLELRPAALVETSIETLLVQLAEAAMSRKKIDMQVNVQGHRTLPQDVQIALYRIAQEAVNNIVKHARASQACITLACQDEQVRLSIRDNGRGFEPEYLEPDRLGLRIIQERAEAMHALFEINSQSGEGTELVITWPEGALLCW